MLTALLMVKQLFVKVLRALSITQSVQVSVPVQFKMVNRWYRSFKAGHVYVAPHPQDVANNYTGFCPFHKGCSEGMAADHH